MSLPHTVAAQRRPITASLMPVIMSGREDWIMERWQVATGIIPEPEPSWPMVIGSTMEPVILGYHADKEGVQWTEMQRVCFHKELYYVSATLDAYDRAADMVVDAKFSLGWQTIDEVLDFYRPQVLTQMICRGAARGGILLSHGGAAPRLYEIERHADYEARMWERADWFYNLLKTKTPPYPMPRIVPPNERRVYDLNDRELVRTLNWAGDMREALLAWDATKDSSDLHTTNVDRVKKLLPDDASKVMFSQFVVTRNRANAVSVKRVFEQKVEQE